MSATDFLPRREADVRDWSIGFHAQLVAQGEAVGVSPERVADYSAKHQAFLESYGIAHAPLTRSPVNIRAKNEALETLRQSARQLARMIRSTPFVTDEQKSELGLTVRRGGGRSPLIPKPDHAPQVIVRRVAGHFVSLRLLDATSTRRGRPVGVRSAAIFMFVGDEPPVERARWRFLKQTNKTRLHLTIPASVPAGERVWLFAQWTNPRGEMGPVSRPVSFDVANGGPVFVPMRRAA